MRSLALPLVLGCACATCTPPQPPASAAASSGPTAPAAPVAAGVDAEPTEPPPATKPAVAVSITGVIARSPVPVEGSGPGSETTLEICPGDALRPCSGVRVVGEIPPELVSTRDRVVVARVSGRYDGARISIDGPGERVPSPAEPDYRNPCPEFQAEQRGDVNPSPRLAALGDRIQREHPERHAGTFWDRTRRTLTVRLTGETSELAARLKGAIGAERLCLAGNASHSQAELLAALETITARLAARRALLVEAWTDVVQNDLVLRVENVDRALIDEVKSIAGSGVRLESFIELRGGSLADLPAPPTRGQVPLVTEPRRWSYGGMHALGTFRVRLDEAARCVFLEGSGGDRILPIWPHGYAAYEQPFRIEDFDGALVATSAPSSTSIESLSFGGGNVSLDGLVAPPAERCGAASAWVGTPAR